ncbi:hypothetical protein ANN_17439 [Periplaneta americana]|uniref:Per a allergen n=1 Tax=Periplaneta americana TaxID=6978 RepID=A0ABQ8SU57_PERAM|nr:hypothetical protein ANN_17439 [Periplaneta americana]
MSSLITSRARTPKPFLNHIVKPKLTGMALFTWAAKSPDPITCDFSSWGHLKSAVFSNPSPRNIEELK